MAEDKQPPVKQIKVKIQVDPQLAGGNYANLCLVNHSDSEFILDFFFLQPQKPEAKHASRLVISPRNAKRLHKVLGDHIKKYEELFGEIKILVGPQTEIVH